MEIEINENIETPEILPTEEKQETKLMKTLPKLHTNTRGSKTFVTISTDITGTTTITTSIRIGDQSINFLSHLSLFNVLNQSVISSLAFTPVPAIEDAVSIIIKKFETLTAPFTDPCDRLIIAFAICFACGGELNNHYTEKNVRKNFYWQAMKSPLNPLADLFAAIVAECNISKPLKKAEKPSAKVPKKTKASVPTEAPAKVAAKAKTAKAKTATRPCRVCGVEFDGAPSLHFKTCAGKTKES
jgi:hypothetical protein